MHLTHARAALAAALVSVLAATSAQAGPAAEKMAQGEQLLAQGKPATALKTAREAFDLLWNKMPFTIVYATFSDKKATGYGIFNPRRSNAYKAGDTIYLYVEPKGFGMKEVKKGIFTIQMVTDLMVKKKNGTVVVDKKGFGKFRLTSRRRFHEFYITLSITLTGAPAGDYALVVPVHDLIKGQTSTFSLPFSVVQ